MTRRKIMRFRPCIDIHNGKVKQIIGGSLRDTGNQAQENFVSQQDGAFYASLYKEKDLKGGHIILLNRADSEYFEANQKAGLSCTWRISRRPAAWRRRNPGQCCRILKCRRQPCDLSPPMFSATVTSPGKTWRKWYRQ